MKLDAGFEVQCKHCGALFVSKQREIPSTLQCSCQGIEFDVQTVVN